MKTNEDEGKDKPKKDQKKYKKPAFTKHGKLGRMIVAMTICCLTERMRRAAREGSRRQMQSLLRDIALSR